MEDKICNIGLYYQKDYFSEITFDYADNFKEKEEEKINDRNQVLLGKHNIYKKYFYCGLQQIDVQSIYPGIITGIGMKHETGIKGEFKLGMYFDYTSGMPCIPGSSVKGALRSAFPQFEKHKKTEKEYKNTKAYLLYSILNKIAPDKFPVQNEVKENSSQEEIQKIINTYDYSLITKLEEEIFNGQNYDPERKDEKGEMKKMLSVYEKDIFHDGFIVNGDVKGRIIGNDAITHHPEPLNNPIPVLFLKILPGVGIRFNFDLKKGSVLSAIQKKDHYLQIFLTLGIGAKTNVGYGQFVNVQPDTEIKKPAQAVLRYSLPDNLQFATKIDKGSILQGIITDIKSGPLYRVQVFVSNKSEGYFDLKSEGFQLEMKQKVAIEVKGFTKGAIQSENFSFQIKINYPHAANNSQNPRPAPQA